MQHTDLTRESGNWVGSWGGGHPQDTWELVKTGICTLQKELGSKLGPKLMRTTSEAFAMWVELSRAGFHPLDPEWEAGCMLETRKEEKGFSW